MKIGNFHLIAFLLLLCLAIPAYAEPLVTKGVDEYGRPIEMIKLPNGGTEVHTYDPKTGIELFSKTYVGSYTGPDTWFPKVQSESKVNSETGERTVITYNDPYDHSKGKTERKYTDSRVLDQIRRNKQAEEDRLRYEREMEQIRKGEFSPPKISQREGDEVDFLPDFVPGVSVYENMDQSAPPQAPPSKPADTGKGKGHGWFGGKSTGTFPPDAGIDSKPEPDKDTMPLAEPEPLAPEPEPVQDTAKDDKIDSGPDFSLLGGVNEPVPEEIDFSKYGDMVFDASRGIVSYINPQTKAVTEILPRHGGWFGDDTWTTQAITKIDGKVVHIDYYAHNRRLVQSTEVNPSNGVKTSTIFNRDGTVTMEQRDDKGKLIGNKVTTKDPKTGQTTTSVGNPDGTHTVTVTDKDGKVIDRYKTKDGIRLEPDTKAKKVSSAKTNAFSAADSLSSVTTSTAHLENSPSARNMNSEASLPSASGPVAEGPHCPEG